MPTKIDSIRAYGRNPRRISQEQLQKLCESIQRDPQFMRLRPIVTDAKGEIIGGNQRWKACKKLGMKELPDGWVVCAADLTDEQRRRFVLVDNAPQGMAGEWDEDILKTDFDLPELKELGFDFDGMEPETETDAEPQIDRAEELQEKWATERGQLWAIGDHRLLCGDSTCAEDVGRVMGGEKAGCVLTDPPYGIGKLMSGGTWATKEDAQFSKMREWDDTTEQRFFDIASSFGPCVIWGGNYFLTPPSRCWLAWNKPEFPSVSSVELAWTNLDHNSKRIECGRTHQTDGKKDHATQKPIVVMQWSIGFLPQGIVLDPFLGSGTTMVAAQNLGRKCYGIEISPAYCAVILERMITAFPTLDIHKIT